MSQKEKSKTRAISSELLQLKKDFSHWRKNKKNHRERIPEILMERSFSFLDRYSMSILCQYLGLNYEDFKKKLKSYKSEKGASPNFIELKLPESSKSYCCDLSFSTSSGKHLDLHFTEIGLEDLKNLMSDFLED